MAWRRFTKKGKKSKKTYRKKRSYKKSIGGGRVSRFPGFPNNKVVRMRYCDNVVLDASTTGHANVFFRANSIFQPPLGGAGIDPHQPLGYDQWAPFYNHYVVLGSKIKIRAQYTKGVAGTSLFGVCYLTDDQTASTDYTDLVEQGGCSYCVIDGNAANSGPYRMSRSFSAKNFFNVVDVKDNLDRLGAAYNANPTEDAMYCLGLQTFNNSPAAVAECTYFITIDYIVSFSEPRELPEST